MTDMSCVHIKEVKASANGATSWFVYCDRHDWFKEITSLWMEGAETHAERHMKAYHKEGSK